MRQSERWFGPSLLSRLQLPRAMDAPSRSPFESIGNDRESLDLHHFSSSLANMLDFINSVRADLDEAVILSGRNESRWRMPAQDWAELQQQQLAEILRRDDIARLQRAGQGRDRGQPVAEPANSRAQIQRERLLNSSTMARQPHQQDNQWYDRIGNPMAE